MNHFVPAPPVPVRRAVASVMDLLVIRHAIAADPATMPMTRRARAGREKEMRQAVRAALGPDRPPLARPPHARGRNGGDCVDCLRWREAGRRRRSCAGTSIAAVAQWLRSQRRHDVVAVVGHEPSLSEMVTGCWRNRALLHRAQERARLSPDLPGDDRGGGATLVWSLTRRSCGATNARSTCSAPGRTECSADRTGLSGPGRRGVGTPQDRS